MNAKPYALILIAAIAIVMALVTVTASLAQTPTNCDTGSAALNAEERQFLELINQYRADNGRAPLTISTNLNRAAAWLAEDMGAEGYFSHTDSLGRSPSQRAQDCGYPSGAGENIAAGTNWDTAEEAFTAWRNSPGHNANMLNSSYRQIGIAVAYDPDSTYRYYWVTDFGLVNDGTGGTPTPTATATPTSSPTSLPTSPASPTPTATSSPTATPSLTPSPPSTSTPTTSPSPTASPTEPPDVTPSPSPTLATPSPTATARPTRTETPLPTVTPEPRPLNPWCVDDLYPGLNLIGACKTVPLSRLDLADYRLIACWDARAGDWDIWTPAMPAWAMDLRVIHKGDRCWVWFARGEQ